MFCLSRRPSIAALTLGVAGLRTVPSAASLADETFGLACNSGRLCQTDFLKQCTPSSAGAGAVVAGAGAAAGVRRRKRLGL